MEKVMLIVLFVALLVVAVLPSSISNRTREKKRQIDKRAHSLGMDPIFESQPKTRT